MAERAKRKSENERKSLGGELVRRLQRFTEKLEQAESPPGPFTCRTVKLNLRPAEYDGARVKETRALLEASQAIFAQFLGVSLNAVQDWEQDAKRPRGSARRFMDEIRRDPSYFQRRLREAVVEDDAGQDPENGRLLNPADRP